MSINPCEIGHFQPGSLASEERVLRMIDGLPIPPADQRNDLGGLALYRAVSAVRIAMRRRDTQPGELARAAGLLYGLPADSILRLAVEAEDGCQRARAALR